MSAKSYSLVPLIGRYSFFFVCKIVSKLSVWFKSASIIIKCYTKVWLVVASLVFSCATWSFFVATLVCHAARLTELKLIIMTSIQHNCDLYCLSCFLALNTALGRLKSLPLHYISHALSFHPWWISCTKPELGFPRLKNIFHHMECKAIIYSKDYVCCWLEGLVFQAVLNITGAYSKWATQVTPPRSFTHEGCRTQSYMVAKHKEWHQRDCTHLQGVFQNQKGTTSCTTVSMVMAYSFLTVHICRLCYLSAQPLSHYDGCSLQVARSNWPREDRHRRGDS